MMSAKWLELTLAAWDGPRLLPAILLGLCDHRGERQPKSPGDTMRHIQARVSFAPFDQPDVGVVDVRFLGKQLLAQSLCFPVPKNYRTEGQRDAAAIRHRGPKMALRILRYH
jgi:hypothetical protein